MTQKSGKGSESDKHFMFVRRRFQTHIKCLIIDQTLLWQSFRQSSGGNPLFLKHGCPIKVLGHDRFCTDYCETVNNNFRKEKDMKRFSYFFAFVFVLMSVGSAVAQEFPIMDMIANNVIQKYQQMNCEQLWKQKSQPKTAQQQEFIKILHADPQMRTAFINKVAPAILNKMFECGMIP